MNPSHRFRIALVSLVSILGCSSSSNTSDPADASSADAHTQQQADASISDSSPPLDASSAADSSGNGDDSSTLDAGSSLSFGTDIYGPIIHEHCIGCHGPTADGGPGPGEAFGKLDMSNVDAGYANLVNVPANGVACGDIDGSPGPVRVVPGNAPASLLYLKVDGYSIAPPCGSAMPKSGEIPDGGQAVVVAKIQTWIDQGANP
jgi:mono/diheme cytochrome c family protein